MPPQQPSVVTHDDVPIVDPIMRESSVKNSRRINTTRSNINKGRKKKVHRNRIGDSKESNTNPASTSSSSSIRRNTIAKEESDDIGNTDATTTTSPILSSLDANGLAYGGSAAVSPYGLYGGTASMMPPASPYMAMGGMGGIGGMGGLGLPYFSGINQTMYGVQNLIVSISQVIQVVGTNQQALQHAWESLNKMVDQAVATFAEMRALESIEREIETEEDRRRRKRLKALRYALVFGGGWFACKMIRNLLFRKKRLVHQQRQLQQQSGSDYNGQGFGYPGYNYQGGYGQGYY